MRKHHVYYICGEMLLGVLNLFVEEASLIIDRKRKCNKSFCHFTKCRQ